MKNNPTNNEKIVIDFLKMVEDRKSPEELNHFYHPHIEQTEFPNAVTKNKVVRSLQELKAGAERGRKVISGERYEIKKLYSFEDTVILEAVWKGTLAVPLGNIPAEGEMTAYFAQVFEFKDGKIFRQRNYDCFESFI